MDQRQTLRHLLPVLPAQDAQPSGVGVAPRGRHILAGHQLRVDVAGHQHAHPPGHIPLGEPRHIPSVQIYRAAHRFQLPDDAFQYGGLPGPVGADERHDLSPGQLQPDLPDQRPAVVSHGQVPGMQVNFSHTAPLSGKRFMCPLSSARSSGRPSGRSRWARRTRRSRS